MSEVEEDPDAEFGPLTWPESFPVNQQMEFRLRDPAVVRRHLVAPLDDLELIYGPMPQFHVVAGPDSILRQCVKYADIIPVAYNRPPFNDVVSGASKQTYLPFPIFFNPPSHAGGRPDDRREL